MRMSFIDTLIEADKRSPRKILVIGDGMTDFYVHGHLEDSQDGCQKFMQEAEYCVLGGAGNAARSLRNWNAEVKCIWDAGCGPRSPMKVRFLDRDDRIIFRWDNDEISLNTELARKE